MLNRQLSGVNFSKEHTTNRCTLRIIKLLFQGQAARLFFRGGTQKMRVVAPRCADVRELSDAIHWRSYVGRS